MSNNRTGDIARLDYSQINKFVDQGPGAGETEVVLRTPSKLETVVPDYAVKEERVKLVHSTFDIPQHLQKKLKMYAHLLELKMHQIVTIAIERELQRLKDKLPELEI